MSSIDDSALAWVAKHAAGPLNDADRAAFTDWYAANPRHQGAYLRAQAIWHTLDKATIQQNLRPAQRVYKAPISRRTLLAGGFAAAAALAAVVLSRRAPDAVLKTTTGEFRKVPLADKSIASLNSASHVEVHMTPT
ncbi:MAG: DUF4880 domain-containing protein, partial [Asticcacaulis sp.]|nr:DUF4880 domain-containing protein [Asticcacaulis sp.]